MSEGMKLVTSLRVNHIKRSMCEINVVYPLTNASCICII